MLILATLILALTDAQQPGNPSREIRQDETRDVSRNYSNPSYQGNTPPDDDWHNQPNNDNYYDDPNWPNVKRK